MTYLEYKHKIEFGKDEYDEIDKYCKDKIKWTASPWDLDSVEFLQQYDLPFIKIPSALLTDYNLIEECSVRYDKLILSTGMSTMEEIDGAVESMGGEVGRYRSQLQRCDFSILHCNSSYPAKVNELNLSCIQTLKDRYKVRLGIANMIDNNHIINLFNATIIERHITQTNQCGVQTN